MPSLRSRAVQGTSSGSLDDGLVDHFRFPDEHQVERAHQAKIFISVAALVTFIVLVLLAVICAVPQWLEHHGTNYAGSTTLHLGLWTECLETPSGSTCRTVDAICNSASAMHMKKMHQACMAIQAQRAMVIIAIVCCAAAGFALLFVPYNKGLLSAICLAGACVCLVVASALVPFVQSHWISVDALSHGFCFYSLMISLALNSVAVVMCIRYDKQAEWLFAFQPR